MSDNHFYYNPYFYYRPYFYYDSYYGVDPIVVTTGGYVAMGICGAFFIAAIIVMIVLVTKSCRRNSLRSALTDSML